MMKRILTSALAMLISVATFAQLDRSVRPEPAPAKSIEFGDYEVYKLDNGLTIIVVENDKLPRVSFSLVVDRDPIFEGDKAGYVSLAGQLLRQGTTNRSKDQLDEEIDFIGASLFTGSSNVYAAGLTKYQETLVELLADVALNPSFPSEEFDKLKKQAISGIENAKDDPNSLSSRIFNQSLYGKDHPYGELQSEENVENISIEDCKSYYNNYWTPSKTYITVVGDIKARKAKKLIKKYFGDWQAKEMPSATYPAVPQYDGTIVNVVNRNSSVQTVLSIGNTIDLKPGDPDIVKLRVANQILGGGSMGRLFQNIREDKGYTYGAYSSYDSDRLVGEFSAGASVRNEVTDSAVVEFIKEFERLQNEAVTDEELQAAKNNIIGEIGRSLESPQTIASFALNIQRYNLPADYYSNYLTRLDAVSKEDIMAVAKKYFHTNALVITAVGKGAEIAAGLEKFGPVTYYDFYGEETGPPSLPVPDGMTAQDVLDGYTKALGGNDKLDKVKDLTITSSIEIPGLPMPAKGITMQKRPNLFKNEMSVDGMGVMQKTVYDGKKANISGMGGSKEVTDSEELKAYEAQATFFAETQYPALGYTLELTSIGFVDGEKAYVMEVTSPEGDKSTEFYSVETGLKIKEESSFEGPEGPMTASTAYADYREVNGIMFPFTMTMSQGPQKIKFEVKTIEVNSGLKKGDFN
ncbi:insulinase family protein [Croceimicrobium hydrocarbonivorans]|uniref:Insulinase family protein n=1 Tax=Croceimicrobium hydrocarbonivorans TaxID=2761580 RepID=A0A7H0VBM8_9FLAO|nr:insulinase family protein [Croceimicrobium hydrocarbonivorans]QNR23126.1 insulinase family protein [Croceimicrobium hydrocarbonivorans]